MHWRFAPPPQVCVRRPDSGKERSSRNQVRVLSYLHGGIIGLVDPDTSGGKTNTDKLFSFLRSKQTEGSGVAPSKNNGVHIPDILASWSLLFLIGIVKHPESSIHFRFHLQYQWEHPT